MKRVLQAAVLGWAVCCGQAWALSGAQCGPKITKDTPRLNCSDPQSIRDFKDLIVGALVPETAKAQSWAKILCGDAALSAGFNEPAPPEPRCVPAVPSCRDGVPGWAGYFRRYLPITAQQAQRLAESVGPCR